MVVNMNRFMVEIEWAEQYPNIRWLQLLVSPMESFGASTLGPVMIDIIVGLPSFYIRILCFLWPRTDNVLDILEIACVLLWLAFHP